MIGEICFLPFPDPFLGVSLFFACVDKKYGENVPLDIIGIMIL